MIRLAVTGTDTAVGKTVVARALLAAFAVRGMRVAAMKPVETGTGGGAPGDATSLRATAGSQDALDDVCPYSFDEPLAPLVAAERAGRAIDVNILDSAFGRLTADRDAIVVEGAGGLLVPLTDQLSYAGLFARWQLGLVIVAANRLGAINHTLLTVQVARTLGLRVRCVILNSMQAEPRDAAMETNALALAMLLPGVRVLGWPWSADVADDRALAAQAERLGLVPLHPMEQTT
jgi:dethiobiotin synthetase